MSSRPRRLSRNRRGRTCLSAPSCGEHLQVVKEQPAVPQTDRSFQPLASSIQPPECLRTLRILRILRTFFCKWHPNGPFAPHATSAKNAGSAKYASSQLCVFCPERSRRAKSAKFVKSASQLGCVISSRAESRGKKRIYPEARLFRPERSRRTTIRQIHQHLSAAETRIQCRFHPEHCRGAHSPSPAKPPSSPPTPTSSPSPASSPSPGPTHRSSRPRTLCARVVETLTKQPELVKYQL